MKQWIGRLTVTLAVLFALSGSALAAQEPQPRDTATRRPALYSQTTAADPALRAQMKEAVTAAIRRFDATLDVRDLSFPAGEMGALMQEVAADPALFYYDTCSWRYLSGWNTSEYVTEVNFFYEKDYTPADAAAYEAAVRTALDTLRPGMDALQTALALHDYLIAHTAYDTTLQRDHIYNAYGALVNGVAVCHGYARAYGDLLTRCGIENTTAVNGAQTHIWNLLRLDGEWYHADVTWDDPAPDRIGQVRHNFFLRSDAGLTAIDADSLHSNWTADHACTSTRYESGAFWRDTDAALVFPDADTVCFLRPTGSGFSQKLRLLSRDWDSGRETLLAEVDGVWPVAGRSDSYWNGCFSGLLSRDQWLFFNNSHTVYAFDRTGGGLSSVYQSPSQLYGAALREDTLYCFSGSSPDEPGQLVSVPGALPAVNPFRDISPADACYAPVLWALETGITTGTAPDTFSPDQSCTRGQVVTFLWRAMGCPAPASAVSPFADVKPGDYNYNAVLWAVEQAITNGTGPDTFSPAQPCTNAHILTFLWRAMGSPAQSGDSRWYGDAMNWAAGAGLLDGTGAAEDPNGLCPRGDVVTFLFRCLGNP